MNSDDIMVIKTNISVVYMVVFSYCVPLCAESYKILMSVIKQNIHAIYFSQLATTLAQHRQV